MALVDGSVTKALAVGGGTVTLPTKTVNVTAIPGAFQPLSPLVVTECSSDLTQATLMGQTSANLCWGLNAKFGGVDPGGPVSSATGAISPAIQFQVIGGLPDGSDTRGTPDGALAGLFGGTPGPVTGVGCAPTALDMSNTNDHCVVALTNVVGGFSSAGLPQEFEAVPITFKSVSTATTNGATAFNAASCAAEGTANNWTAAWSNATLRCTLTFERAVMTSNVKTPASAAIGASVSAGPSSTTVIASGAPGTFTQNLDEGRFVSDSAGRLGAGARIIAVPTNPAGPGTTGLVAIASGAPVSTGATAVTLAQFWTLNFSGYGFASGDTARVTLKDSVSSCVPHGFDRVGAGSGATNTATAGGVVTGSIDVFQTCLATGQKVTVTLTGSQDNQNDAGDPFGTNSPRSAMTLATALT